MNRGIALTNIHLGAAFFAGYTTDAMWSFGVDRFK
jgi:hypothetical protein